MTDSKIFCPNCSLKCIASDCECICHSPNNQLVNCDCFDLFRVINKVDYVFTVPPDFDELNLDPGKDYVKYWAFLEDFMNQTCKKSDIITIAITDRKYRARLISKHTFIIQHMLKNGYRLVSHKIWKKTNKINLYRLTYTNILTFANKKIKQANMKEYMYDVYEYPEDKYDKYPYGISQRVVAIFIRNFTKEGDLVFDPFMGSGTTAVAAKRNNRHYIGSEIDKKVYKMAKKRIDTVEL